MDFGEFLNIALPVVYVVVGVALVWFIIELVMMVRKTRSAVDDMQKKIDPTLTSIGNMTASLEPAVAKIDPLVERVSLTVDAANLEIMRLDQILEDVNDITGKVSLAANAVESATSAPIAIVNTMTDKVRGVLRSHRASDESIALGEKKAAVAARGDLPEENPAATLASTSFDAAERFVAEAFAPKEVSQPEHTVDAAEKWAAARAAQASEPGQHAASATPASDDASTASEAEEKPASKGKYFTYEPEIASAPKPKE
ncbi:MAG: DUF948 domain-containing protein [Raoultibacter sp.]